MCKFNIFLLFPYTYEEIMSYGEDIELYESVPKQLLMLKSLIANEDYRLYYDFNNISEFCKYATEFCGGEYLSNIRFQLLSILNKRAIDINNKSLFRKDCNYYKWDDSVLSVDLETGNILKSAAEMQDADKESDVVILSFLNEDRWHRDIMPIIKEAVHYKNLPIFCNVLYFSPIDGFIEWYKNKKAECGFSLSDVSKFERTKMLYAKSKQRIYKEKLTSRYWYYDYFHKDNKEHYEVFNCEGEHLGEADKNGVLNENKQDSRKSIKKFLS